LLASYDPADEDSYSGTGITLFDLTANNNDLTIYGGMESSYDPNGWFTADGVNDLAITTTTPTLDHTNAGHGAFIWFQTPKTNTATQFLFNWAYRISTSDRYGIRLYQFGGAYQLAALNGTTNTQYDMTSDLTANTWMFAYIQQRYNGGVFEVQGWIGDGSGFRSVLDTTVANSVPASLPYGIEISYGGRENSTGPFDGKLGEFSIYDDNYFTSTEVQEIFNNTKARYGY
jgi:hypothetical protein